MSERTYFEQFFADLDPDITDTEEMPGVSETRWYVSDDNYIYRVFDNQADAICYAQNMFNTTRRNMHVATDQPDLPDGVWL